MGFGSNAIIEGLKILPLIIIALSVHEWAHAWAAFKLGDDTARLQGRMTLNPLSHIDPIGTLIVPVLIGFGWAKPVPFNPVALSRKIPMRKGIMLVAVAGPVSNLVQAIVAAAALTILVAFVGLRTALWFEVAVEFITIFVYLNVLLAYFNMIPLGPLDGNKVLYGLLPRRAGDAMMENPVFSKYGVFILVVLILAAGRVPGLDMVMYYPFWPVKALTKLLLFAIV